MKSIYSKMINGKGFWIAMIINFLLVFINMIAYIIRDSGQNAVYGIQASEATMINEYSYVSDILKIIMIFICLFPFSFSYFKDRRLGMNQLYSQRLGRKNYYIYNELCCFTGTFISIFIPLVVETVMDFILFAGEGAAGSGASAYTYMMLSGLAGTFPNTAVSMGIPLLNLYLTHPWIYRMIFVLLFSGFFSLLATWSYVISFYIRKYSMLILIPNFTFYMVMKKIQPVVEKFIGDRDIKLNVINYLFVTDFTGNVWGYFWGVITVLFISICVMTFIKLKKDEI